MYANSGSGCWVFGHGTKNDLQTTIDDCNLLQAEKEYARETLQDLRQEAADEQQRLNDEYEEKRKELDESLAEERKENRI